MKKSRIVSYSSEEIKALPDQSDWEGNAAMTDEEIEAAIASDPDEANLDREWMERGIVLRDKARFVIFLDRNARFADLVVHKVYQVIADAKAEQEGLLRVVDESGKAHSYPTKHFAPVQLSQEAEQNFVVAEA